MEAKRAREELDREAPTNPLDFNPTDLTPRRYQPRQLPHQCKNGDHEATK